MRIFQNLAVRRTYSARTRVRYFRTAYIAHSGLGFKTLDVGVHEPNVLVVPTRCLPPGLCRWQIHLRFASGYYKILGELTYFGPETPAPLDHFT